MMPKANTSNPFVRKGMLAVCLASAALYCVPADAAETVRIGVLAPGHDEQAGAQWKPLAAALQRAVRGSRFAVLAMDRPQLDAAVASRQLDFLLTDPGHYVALAASRGLPRPLATLSVEHNGRRTAAFGGVIFARSDRADIAGLGDVKGRTVAVADTESLGGYRMQARELARAGIRLPDDAKVATAGLSDEAVVAAVLAGRADIGFVRSGVLENMARRGALDIARIKLVNRRDWPDFPARVSTPLYPEWPFAALPHVDEKLARHVAARLLVLREDAATTRALGMRAFALPADYAPVAELLEDLRLHPFELPPAGGAGDAWHRPVLAAVAALLAAGLFLALRGRLQARRDDRKGGDGLEPQPLPPAPRPQEETLPVTGVEAGSDEPARLLAARERDEDRFRLSAAVFANAREGIMITAADGTIVDVNDAFSLITGYGREEVIGRNPSLLGSDRQSKAFYRAMWRALAEKGYWQGELWNRHKNGTEFAEKLTVCAVPDARGNPRHYVSLFSDITLHKEHERELEQAAHYDALTGLPNRALLVGRLRQALLEADRAAARLAVCYLDLDGFKAVNEIYGREAGDLLLKAVAGRMKKQLHDADILARVGGDEFVAVLPGLSDTASSIPILNRLLAAAAQPMRVDHLLLQVSASLGVTFYPQSEALDADQLLRQADQAMYQAKLAGKKRYHVFDAEQDRSVRGNYETLEGIQHALFAREFVLHFQPKANLRTGKVIGAEALIRWQHPQKGLLEPAEFLPAIEDHALAIDLGEWVIDAVLKQLAIWQGAGLELVLSVNVGARQLQQPDFMDRLRAIMAGHPGFRRGTLMIEVLETSVLGDLAHIARIIESCREIGISFALDDFGTGYSSLTYLKRLPVAQLKIDQSFVRGMLDDPDDLAILEGILGMAGAFGREVIAEGVESVEHGELLLQLGCELAQGSGIARPMPAANLPGWAAAWSPDPAWRDRTAVDRGDLPLLFAGSEHRAWMAALDRYLAGETEAPPALDLRRCRFGRWLHGQGLARHGTKPAFRDIEHLHRRVHAMAAELCESHSRAAPPDLGGAEAIRPVVDAMIGQAKALLTQGS